MSSVSSHHPSACRFATFIMHTPKQRTSKLSDYVCVPLDIPRPSCPDETTCRPYIFSLTQAQSSVPVTSRVDICSLTDALCPIYLPVSGAARNPSLNFRLGLFHQPTRLDKRPREQRMFQIPIKYVSRHLYNPSTQCHPLLLRPKYPLNLWTSYYHSFHCPFSQSSCEPASSSTQ